jgi:hypothetical protein
MIFTVLESGDELAPRQITERIRQRWWPDLAPDRINTLVSKLKRSGRLSYSDGRYKKLNVNGHARG